jgi:hypothetical protein
MQSLMQVRNFRSPQNKTDLGPVPMADDNLVAVLDNIDDMANRLADGCVLIVDTLVSTIPYQRVASNGDGDQFGHGSHLADTLLEVISKIGFWFKIAAGPSLKPEVRLRRIEDLKRGTNKEIYPPLAGWAKRHF